VSPAATILAVGWAVAVLYAYPGVMSYDSFEQLHEGRAWFFTDAHPPVMAALWGVVDRVISGPLVMLLLQVTTFLAGVYWILRRAMQMLHRIGDRAGAIRLFEDASRRLRAELCTAPADETTALARQLRGRA